MSTVLGTGARGRVRGSPAAWGVRSSGGGGLHRSQGRSPFLLECTMRSLLGYQDPAQVSRISAAFLYLTDVTWDLSVTRGLGTPCGRDRVLTRPEKILDRCSQSE